MSIFSFNRCNSMPAHMLAVSPNLMKAPEPRLTGKDPSAIEELQRSSQLVKIFQPQRIMKRFRSEHMPLRRSHNMRNCRRENFDIDVFAFSIKSTTNVYYHPRHGVLCHLNCLPVAWIFVGFWLNFCGLV